MRAKRRRLARRVNPDSDIRELERELKANADDVEAHERLFYAYLRLNDPRALMIMDELYDLIGRAAVRAGDTRWRLRSHEHGPVGDARLQEETAAYEALAAEARAAHERVQDRLQKAVWEEGLLDQWSSGSVESDVRELAWRVDTALQGAFGAGSGLVVSGHWGNQGSMFYDEAGNPGVAIEVAVDPRFIDFAVPRDRRQVRMSAYLERVPNGWRYTYKISGAAGSYEVPFEDARSRPAVIAGLVNGLREAVAKAGWYPRRMNPADESRRRAEREGDPMRVLAHTARLHAPWISMRAMESAIKLASDSLEPVYLGALEDVVFVREPNGVRVTFFDRELLRARAQRRDVASVLVPWGGSLQPGPSLAE